MAERAFEAGLFSCSFQTLDPFEQASFTYHGRINGRHIAYVPRVAEATWTCELLWNVNPVLRKC